MVNPKELIDEINKGCKNLFSNTFILKPHNGHYNISLYRIEGSSEALNRFAIPFEPVKVLKWFGKFWVFLEVKFVSSEKVEKRKRVTEIHTYISLSVYEGEDNDSTKNQLFRAEWDDYNNLEELHSQPHWHITSDQAIEKTFSEYSRHFDNEDFLSLLQQEKSKLFDVKNIHFAMNGNWQSNETHIHRIDNEEKIVKWLQGMLNHLRVELT